MSSLIALAVFMVVLVLGQAGRDAEHDAQIEREAAERKQNVKPEDRISLLRLTVPLDCSDASATVKAFKHDHQRNKVMPGCYTRSEK